LSELNPGTPADDPEVWYRRISEQIQSAPPASAAGFAACFIFVIAAVALLLLLELGADLEQLLRVGVAVAAINLVAGVVWATTASGQ
jgi:hypothetical protein